MSDKVEQFCMAGAPPEAVLCALMDENNQLRTTITELNARIDDRNAALLSKTVELSECQKQRDELMAALEDMNSGWKYIRSTHGDLYGVGWDRAQDKADAAIANVKGGA